MALFERSAKANQAIAKIRAYLRRINSLTEELDWFDTFYTSGDEEIIPLLLEKVREASRILQKATNL